jgi:hypothetical protein
VLHRHDMISEMSQLCTNVFSICVLHDTDSETLLLTVMSQQVCATLHRDGWKVDDLWTYIRDFRDLSSQHKGNAET